MSMASYPRLFYSGVSSNRPGRMNLGGPIFVTYARRDAEAVLPIVERLRADSFDLWIDTEGIEGATFWRKEIVRAIEEAPAVVFFASRASCFSENVSKELAIASEEGKPILPVFIEDVRPPSELRYQIAGLQQIAWHSDAEVAYRQIRVALGRLLNKDLPPTGRSSERPLRRHTALRRFWVPLSLAAVCLAGALAAATWYQSVRTKPQAEETVDSKPPALAVATATSAAAPLTGTTALRALVVGNERYFNAPFRLGTAGNDAKSVGTLLRSRGFEVTELLDVTAEELKIRAREFYASDRRVPVQGRRGLAIAPGERMDGAREKPIRSSDTRTLYFVYYSGHAITKDNEPYIVPIDAALQDSGDRFSRMMPLSTLFPSEFGITPRNRLMLYATSPGGTAWDAAPGENSNSPFTRALLEHGRKEELDLFSVFTSVTRDVKQKTRGAQVPWIEGSLDAPIYLANLKALPLDGVTLVAVLDACRDSPFPSR